MSDTERERLSTAGEMVLGRLGPRGGVGVTLQGVSRLVEAEPKLSSTEAPKFTGQVVTQPLTGLVEPPKQHKHLYLHFVATIQFYLQM